MQKLVITIFVSHSITAFCEDWEKKFRIWKIMVDNIWNLRYGVDKGQRIEYY